jgi:hypothetical protein
MHEFINTAGIVLMLLALLLQGKRIMTIADDIKAGQARMSAALLNLSADIRAFINKASGTAGISEADSLAIKAEGDRLADGLEALAAQSENGEATPVVEPPTTTQDTGSGATGPVVDEPVSDPTNDAIGG